VRGTLRGWFTKPVQPVAAVDQVTIAIRAGELFGLLGPNGAGKTTLIKMLATLIAPSAGSAIVNGHDLANGQAIRRLISLVDSEGRSFYWRLTARQNLEFFGALYQLPRTGLKFRIKEVLDLVGLEASAEVPVYTFSSGMKQRLAIARALLRKTPIIFMDEPTRGLDPVSTRRIHRLIRQDLVGGEGITVLLSTNQLWEAEALCHRVAVMHQGRVQGYGTLAELRSDLRIREQWRLVVRNLNPGLKRQLDEFHPPLRIIPQGDEKFLVEWEAEAGGDADGLMGVILKGGGKIISLSREEASLENIFDTLTERPNPGIGQSQEPAQALESEQRENPGISGQKTNAELPSILAVLCAWPRLAGAFLKRDFLEEWSYQLAFSIELLGIFFTITMYYFLSKLFAQTVNTYLTPYGTDYFSFVILGVAFYRYFDVGLSTLSNRLREAQTTGTLEAMFASSTDISLIVIFSFLWSNLFASLEVAVYLGLGKALFKAHLVNFNLTAVFVIMGLSLICFNSLGIIAASFIMVYKRGNPLLWVFSTVSGLLSGIYYPVEILPAWLKHLAYVLPTTYVMEAVRLCFLQGYPLWAMRRELAVLSLFCVVLLPVSLLAFRLAVRRVKVDGSLTHY
jgi:ABC-2 type transport system permease protein